MSARPVSRRKPALTAKRLVSVVTLASLGAAIIGIMLGYFLGTTTASQTLTIRQSEFVMGVVQGTRFRTDFEVWEKTDSEDGFDVRAFPEERCAGEFYPTLPIAMSGCIQGLNDPPPAGYNVPLDIPKPR